MKYIASVFTFCAALLTASAAEAKVITYVGGWAIGIDSAVHGCYMSMSYDNDVTFRVGIDRTNDRAFIWLQHDAFNDLSEGETYPLEIDFDNGNRWKGEGEVIRTSNDSLLLEIPFDRSDLLRDLMHRDAIYFYHRGELLTSLRLDGSHNAIDAMLECQRQYD
jgi:hypothetical protein